MELTQLLLATQDHGDNAKRQEAERQIQSAEQQSHPQYLLALADELAREDKPLLARQLAGLLLKNSLWAKEPARHQAQQERWVSFQE